MSDELFEKIEELLQFDDKIVEEVNRLYHENGWKHLRFRGEVEGYGMAIIHQKAAYEAKKRLHYRELLNFRDEDVNEEKVHQILAVIMEEKTYHLENLDWAFYETILDGVYHTLKNLLCTLNQNRSMADVNVFAPTVTHNLKEGR